MTGDSDIQSEMSLIPLSDAVADGLFSGEMSPDEAGDQWAGVAAAFQVATASPAPGARGIKTTLLEACVAEVRSSHQAGRPTTPRRKTVVSKIRTAKTAVAALAVTIGVGAASAAAATGSLPGQASHANSHAAHGIATAAAHAAKPATSSTTSAVKSSSGPTGSIPATGPANQHAQFGLCNTFLQAGKNATGSSPATPPQYSSTAFTALINQNGGVAATKTYCQGIVSAHSATTNPHGSANSSKSGHGKPAGTGKPSSPGSSGSASHD